MLINKETMLRIEQILNDHINALIIAIGGRDQLSEEEVHSVIAADLVTPEAYSGEELIEDAYFIGRMRQEGHVVPREPEKFLALKQALQTQLSGRDKSAIEFAKLKLAQGLRRHRDTVRATVTDLVLSGNYEYHNAVATPVQILEEGLQRKETVAKIASNLRDKTGDLYRDWRRVVITEMTNTMNMGAMDQIVEDNKDKVPSTIYVYKVVVNDAILCDVCRRVYLEPDNGTPKVYPLSELQANGTNYGKKQSEWKAVIGSTHPHCRCRLLQLPDGWGFVKGSPSLQFYGKDIIWYRDKNTI